LVQDEQRDLVDEPPELGRRCPFVTKACHLLPHERVGRDVELVGQARAGSRAIRLMPGTGNRRVSSSTSSEICFAIASSFASRSARAMSAPMRSISASFM